MSKIPKENREILFKDSAEARKDAKCLRIIHFNDVYNIEGARNEPIGSAARFKTVIDELAKEKDSILLFSGDAVSPSMLSLFAKGNQMIEAMNKFDLHAAAIGNHEFDMGVDVLVKLIEKSNFPWLLSNVFDGNSKEMLPLAKAFLKTIIEINGLKIGVFALAEKEWVASLSTVNFDDVIYEPYVLAAKELSTELKEHDKCDIVIALTHMRWGNDEKLAEKAKKIDLFLGGHDHEYGIKEINNHWVIKSGTDFKELTLIEIEYGESFHVRQIEKITIDSKISEDLELKKIADFYLADATKQLEKELGIVNVDLDGRHSAVRYKESNLGNFLCDIILNAIEADCSLLNGGSLRSNALHKAGSFTRRDLRDILSFDSELVVVSVKGSELHEVLENCVAKYGEGGRYPQVSGIFFAFDPRKPAMKRIDPRIIKIQNEYLDLEKEYKLATNVFMRNVDSVLKDCPEILKSENIPQLYILVENHFQTVNELNAKKKENQDNHLRISIVPKAEINSIMKQLSGDPDVLKPTDVLGPGLSLGTRISFKTASIIVTKALKHRKKVLLKHEKDIIKQNVKYKKIVNDLEAKFLKLAPEVEGRSIKIENDEQLQNLLNQRD